MKRTSLFLVVVCSLCLAGTVWGQTQIDHFFLKKWQAIGWVQQDNGQTGHLQVDYFEQRDGSFFVRIYANFDKYEEPVMSIWANFENIPKSYVQVSSGHIAVDIPDVTALTGDYGCNGSYQDPTACPQPLAIHAMIFKNNDTSSRSNCVSKERGNIGSFHSGGAVTLQTAFMDGYVLGGEFFADDYVNSWYIYGWTEKVRNLFKPPTP